jgi:hypothetical protein
MPIRRDGKAMRRIEIAGRQTRVINGGKDEVQDLLTDGCWRTF